MSLEAAFGRAAAGGLTGLTLYKTADGWQASARDAGSAGWTVVVGDDPVVALAIALGLFNPAPATEDLFG